jgi:hypothetical protein
MPDQDKVRENRLRRIAERRGLKLEKSRRRDPHARDFGGFMLIEPQTKATLLGSDGFAFSATLDDVDAYLSARHASKKPSAALERALALTPGVVSGDPVARAEFEALLNEEHRKEKERIARGGKRRMVITATYRSKGATAKKAKREKR